MRSLASLLFLIIIMFPIFIFYNKKLENIKPPKLIKYRPIDTNIIDMQFDTYKIKKESIKIYVNMKQVVNNETVLL